MVHCREAGKGYRVPAIIRQEIQSSDKSARSLAKYYGLNIKTVLRWRHRTEPQAVNVGSRRQALNPLVEALAMCLRVYANLPLDDCLRLLNAVSSGVSRSSLYRFFRSKGLGRIRRQADSPLPSGWYDVDLLPLGPSAEYGYIGVAIETRSGYMMTQILSGEVDARLFLAYLQQESPLAIVGMRLQQWLPPRVIQSISEACTLKSVHLRYEGKGQKAAEKAQCAGSQLGGNVSIDELQGDLASMLSELVAQYNYYHIHTSAEGAPVDVVKQLKGDVKVSKHEHGEHPSGSTRDRILSCTRTVMSMSGPEGISLSKVARMAGVNRGTLYHYFPTKKALVETTAEWVSEQLLSAVFAKIDADVKPSNGPQKALGFLRALADYSMHNPSMSRAWMMRMLTTPEPSRDKFWCEYYRRSSKFHTETFSEKVIDTEVLAVIQLTGALFWPTWTMTKFADQAVLKDQSERYVREYFRLVTEGALPPSYVHDAQVELKRMANV